MQRPRPSHLALFLLAYVLAAGFAQWLAIIPGTGISIWPPAGVYVATLLLAPRAQWPWWIATAALAELVANALWFANPVPMALLIHAGNAACALLAATLIGRFVPTAPLRLESLRDVLALAVLGAAVAPLASASVGAATLAWAQGQPLATSWSLWWVGDATGVLIVAPLVLVAVRDWQERPRPGSSRVGEAVLLAVVLCAAAVLALGGALPFAYIVMPPLLWAAVRFEFRGAAATSIALALMTAVFTTTGMSPFSGDASTQGQRHLMLQLFLAISALSSLVVAALARQNRLAMHRLRHSNDELERRVAERTAALTRSEQRLRTLGDAVPVSIWVTDAAGHIEFVNREYEQFFGTSEAQVRSGKWQALVHPDDEAAYVEAFAIALREHSGFEASARMRRADGAWRYIMSRGVPRHDDGGRFVGMVGSSTDISDRRRYEQALSAEARRKDEFLAMLAHELRNPLAPIRSAVELLRVAGGTPQPAVENARAMIERQVAHLVRLVDDLLDVARVSRGRIALRRAPIDLVPVVQQAVETNRPLIDARRHTLALSLPSGPLRVDGDATRIAQSVGNLVNNAAKYTEVGGRIEVELRSDGEQALIRIADNGRGIDAQHMDSLFTMFYQAPGALERAEGGLGIGLALVRRLVQLHGGTIDAHSAGLGQGSEFVIRLPLLTQTLPALDEAPVPVATAPAPGRRVLVVDDNRDAAESTAELLRMDGHDVHVAYDGREAVALALQLRPQAVLLDIGLPLLNGYEACRAMREGGLDETLIVALTGYGQEQDRQLTSEAGFDAHWVKPVDLSALHTLLVSGVRAPLTPAQ